MSECKAKDGNGGPQTQKIGAIPTLAKKPGVHESPWKRYILNRMFAIQKTESSSPENGAAFRSGDPSLARGCCVAARLIILLLDQPKHKESYHTPTHAHAK